MHIALSIIIKCVIAWLWFWHFVSKGPCLLSLRWVPGLLGLTLFDVVSKVQITAAKRVETKHQPLWRNKLNPFLFNKRTQRTCKFQRKTENQGPVHCSSKVCTERVLFALHLKQTACFHQGYDELFSHFEISISFTQCQCRLSLYLPTETVLAVPRNVISDIWQLEMKKLLASKVFFKANSWKWQYAELLCVSANLCK